MKFKLIFKLKSVDGSAVDTPCNFDGIIDVKEVKKSFGDDRCEKFPVEQLRFVGAQFWDNSRPETGGKVEILLYFVNDRNEDHVYNILKEVPPQHVMRHVAVRIAE